MANDIGEALGVERRLQINTEVSTRGNAERAGKRYREAYMKARFIVSVGMFFRILCIVIGGLMILSGMITCGSANSNNQGFSGGQMESSIGVLAAILGLVAGIFGWIIGTGIMAAGEMLKASLDHAVHTSPFLDDSQRAEAMSL